MRASYSAQNAVQMDNSICQQIKFFELKILSWNIYMLPYLSLFNNNFQRAKVIADKLNVSDYHVIVFQEAFSSKCRRILAENMSQSYPYQYGQANKNGWTGRHAFGWIGGCCHSISGQLPAQVYPVPFSTVWKGGGR